MARQHTASIEEQKKAMERYYALQSKIYDLTRWTFLFGRRRLIRELPISSGAKLNILEIGCGTGYNLLRLAQRFPNACLTGLDVSAHMIRRAGRATGKYRERVSLIQQPYSSSHQLFSEKMDLVLFSYSLTMINPQWKELILQAKEDLKPGGIIAVVDFYNSKWPWFKRHMGNNHVRMDGHLSPTLRQGFKPVEGFVKPAYGGLWHYFMFIGVKKVG